MQENNSMREIDIVKIAFAQDRIQQQKTVISLFPLLQWMLKLLSNVMTATNFSPTCACPEPSHCQGKTTKGARPLPEGEVNSRASHTTTACCFGAVLWNSPGWWLAALLANPAQCEMHSQTRMDKTSGNERLQKSIQTDVRPKGSIFH